MLALCPFHNLGTIEMAAKEPAAASSRSLFHRLEQYEKAYQNFMPFSIASTRFE